MLDTTKYLFFDKTIIDIKSLLDISDIMQLSSSISAKLAPANDLTLAPANDLTLANKQKTLEYFRYLRNELKRTDVDTYLIPLVYLQVKDPSDDKNQDDLLNKKHHENYGDFIDDNENDDQSLSSNKQTYINTIESDMCYDYNIPIPINKIDKITTWINSNENDRRFEELEREHIERITENNNSNENQDDNENGDEHDENQDDNEHDENQDDNENGDEHDENQAVNNLYKDTSARKIQVKQLFDSTTKNAKLSIVPKSNVIIHTIKPIVIDFDELDTQDISDWLLANKNIDIQNMKKIRKRNRRPMYKTKIKNMCEVYNSLDDCIELIYAFAQDPSVFDSFAVNQVEEMTIHYINIIDENNILFVVDLPGSSYECDTCHFDLQYNEKINAWCNIEGNFENGDFSIVVMDIQSLLK
jgi:hypothetical protein